MNIGKINRAFLLIAFLWTCSLCHCWASYQITGVVREQKSKDPVEGAFVLAYSGNTQKGFAYSGEAGQFSIKVADGVRIDAIRVSMMGYAPAVVETEGRTSGIVIELAEKAMRITPSTVKTHPIRRKGDTLSYYVQAFTDGTERVLDDLLNRIPGLSTNEQGTITFEGEAINRFYVEDLDLMGSKYGVVTNNLKASDIARIDVYLNHQPIQALRDIKPSEKSAVNIVLKESAKGAWIFTGDALIGLPPFPLFDAKAMVSRFSRTRQSLFLLKGNNLGKDISLELRNQPGVSDRPMYYLQNGDLDNQLSSPLSPSFSTLPVPKEYWFDNLSGIASFNHLVKCGKEAKLRLSFNAAAEKYSEQALSSETLRFEDGTDFTIEDTKSLTDRKYYFQGNALYEVNSSRRFFSESLDLSGQLRSNLSTGVGRNTYLEDYDLPSFKADNTLRLTLRKGKKAIKVESLATYVRNSHAVTFETGDRSYDQSYLQNTLTSSHGASFVASAGRHSLSAEASVGLDYFGLNTNLVPSADLSDLHASLKDELSVFSLIPSLDLRDVINWGKVRLTTSIPIALHVLDVKGRKGIVYPSFAPSLSLRYSPNSYLTASAAVSYSQRRSSPETLLGAVVMRDYRTFYLADSLSQNSRLSARVNVRYSNPVDMVFLTLRGGAARIKAGLSTSREYYPDYTVVGYVPLENATSLYNIDGDASKYFGGKVFMIEARAGYKVSEADEYLQNTPVHYVTRTFNTGGTLRTNPVAWFSAWFKLDYTRRFSDNGKKEIVSTLLTGEGAMRVSPLSKLDLELDCHFRRDQIPGVSVFNKPLLKATISWRLKKGTIYVECNNLLDVREYRRETISSYRTISSVNHLRGRQFLTGIRMSL